MPRTSIPNRRATTACDSSWITRQPKNATAVRTPITACSASGSSGYASRKAPVAAQEMSTSTANHDACTHSLMPSSRPIGIRNRSTGPV
jgi:hypothetical protein